MEKLQNGLAIVVALAVMTVVLAWPTQVLWNTSLVPAIDGVNAITFWQALGINFLAAILFKGSNITKNND